MFCVFLERGFIFEVSKMDMVYIYMNVGLVVVGIFVVVMVIVGIVCLMKRIINVWYE